MSKIRAIADTQEYIAEFGRFRNGDSHANHAIYQRTPGGLEVRGARLRGPIRRYHPAGGLGASPTADTRSRATYFAIHKPHAP